MFGFDFLHSSDAQLEDKTEDDRDIGATTCPNSKTSATDKNRQPGQSSFVFNLWWSVFIAIVISATASRLYKLELGEQVCWDETHFGKMAGWYINKTLYFDVHPPLGKVLIAGMGYMTGYNGSFTFEKPGLSFAGHNVMGMRYGSALLGTAIIPVGFLTVWEMTGSVSAAALGSMLLLFDTGLATLSRFILLDQPMILGMTLSFFCLIKFRKLENEAFSQNWWVWLTLQGLALWATISIKFVGLFIVLFVGAFAAFDLWNIFGDLNKSWETLLRHFLARVACLIALPVFLYLCLWYIHFSILTKSGPGDGYYSPLFQSTLEGNYLQDKEVTLDAAYGSVITLKAHQSIPCGYLHSHWDLFPSGVGAEQQVVSSYIHRDDNNKFIIKRWHDGSVNSSSGESDLVRHGDLIKLQHLVTGRNLHSHNIPAIKDKKFYQITGYGDDGEGDDNDVWRIEIVDGKEGDVVRTLTSPIKLRHHFLNCLMTCMGEQLPKEWGYGQSEVACSPWQKHTKENNGFHEFAWIIEENSHEDHAMIPVKMIEPNFIFKFIEAHYKMLYVNKRIGGVHVPGEAESHVPRKWPLNIITQKFCPTEPRITLLGNPIVWWLNLGILAIFPFIAGKRLFLSQRMESPPLASKTYNHITASLYLFSAWAIHYIPFFFMYRVLYVHHYYPAFYFSSLLSGVFLDLTIKSIISNMPHQIKPLFQMSFLVGLFSIMSYSYIYFSPVVYGMSGNEFNQAKMENSSYHYLHWLESWDI